MQAMSVACLFLLQIVLGQNTIPLRSFDRVLLLESKGETSAGVSMGDMDGDGDLDLVFAKGRHWPLHNLIFRNDGKGRFTTEMLGESPDRTYTAALADLNGDGHLDVVVSNDKPDSKRIYLNDGKGRFRAAGTYGAPDWTTRYVTVADLNGDRRPDIIVANRGGAKNPVPSFVCLNDGKGAFPSCRPLPTQSATIIVAADLDGDGFIDLIVPHRDGGQSLIFWNDGSGKFAAKPTAFGPPVSMIRAAAAADLDGDGRIDIVTGDEAKGVFLYRNAGKRAFDSETTLSGKPGTYSIAIGDLNRDGKPDIVVGYQNARGSIHFNQSSANQFHEISWNDGQGAVYGLAIGDLDGDGWPDIAGARSDAPNAVWFNGPAAHK